MQITTIGLDLAKNVFQVHGVDGQGQAVLRKQLRRSQVVEFFAKVSPCTVAMEACGGAHHWGRTLQSLGHKVLLIAPQYVKPYVKSQKNDAADAAAICEAASRRHMRFVALKDVEQQSVQAIHTVRSGFIKQRTAISNQIRGLLAEFGVVIPVGLSTLRSQVPVIVQDQDNGVPVMVKTLIGTLLDQVKLMDDQIAQLDCQIRQWALRNEAAKRLQQVSGIGPISASALVAGVGNARQFANARQMAAWMGLVPRQHSSGGKTVLLGITKRGDKYLRTLLIHGARAALLAYQRNPATMPERIKNLLARKHPNVACVALANRNARIAWALLAKGDHYRSDLESPMPMAA